MVSKNKVFVKFVYNYVYNFLFTTYISNYKVINLRKEKICIEDIGIYK